MIGRAAVTIWCDIALEARTELNHWHAHEHMPERLSIPGFLRGSRWVADQGLGYFMLYEAASEEAITGSDYLARLNNPTPWSRRMMPHHRNMVRGPCRIESRFGAGLGQALLTLRLSPQPGEADALGRWLDDQLAAMVASPGLVAAARLRNIGRPTGPLTTEQQLRGGDRTPDWVVLVSGYDTEAIAALAAREFDEPQLTAHGALPGASLCILHLAYVLTSKANTP
jgi:hypothetical protein